MRHEKKLTMRTAIASTLAIGVVAIGATTASADEDHSGSGDNRTSVSDNAPAPSYNWSETAQTASHQKWREGAHSQSGGESTTESGTSSGATESSTGTSSTGTSSSGTFAPTTFAQTTTTSTMAGLSANTQRVRSVVLSRWPALTNFSGYRAGAGDHGTGRALDTMIPGWSSASGQAQGQAVADYFKAHASELGVTYVIWRQQIWSVARSSEGWRTMADRGSATQNHYDHVHVSVS